MKYDYDDLFPAVKTRMNKLALVAVAHTYGEAGRDDATDRWNAICFDHGTKLAAVVRVHDGGTAEYRVVMCVDVPSMYGGVDDCRVFLLDDATADAMFNGTSALVEDYHGGAQELGDVSEMLTTVDDVATGEDYIMDQLEKWLPHLADADKQHAADVAEFVAHKAAAEKAAAKPST